MLVWKITQIKTLLTAIFDFLFANILLNWLSLLSPLSSDAQSYTEILNLKTTTKNAWNVIYKIISYFPQPVQGTRHTTLFYFSEN